MKASIPNVAEFSVDAVWEKVEKSGLTRIPTQKFSRFDVAAPFSGSLYVVALREEKRNMLQSVDKEMP